MSQISIFEADWLRAGWLLPGYNPPSSLPGISPEADSAGGGVSDQGRGSGCSSSAPARIAPVVRTVCYIAAELVRLVSCVESMKPVLQSLYHRILLYPPPQHRTEAIRIMKEVGPLLKAKSNFSTLLKILSVNAHRYEGFLQVLRGELEPSYMTSQRSVCLPSDSGQSSAPVRPGRSVCR